MEFYSIPRFISGARNLFELNHYILVGTWTMANKFHNSVAFLACTYWMCPVGFQKTTFLVVLSSAWLAVM